MEENNRNNEYSINKDSETAKEYINKLSEYDPKLFKDLEEIVYMFKKPFWKVVICIVLASSIINIFYQLGYFIGKLIGSL